MPSSPSSETRPLLAAAKERSFYRSARFCLSIVGFLGFANLYALRVNMSVVLVSMVNETAADADVWNDSYSGHRCEPSENDLVLRSKEDGPFTWTKSQQGLILSSFFWGYILTQIPGGMLAERIGGKHVFLWPMLLAAVCTLLCPLAARLHYGALIVLRVLIGIGEGVAFPAMHAIWAQWAPPYERSRLTGICYSGAHMGSVVILLSSGLLSSSVGWPSVFYLFGSLGILWCIAWYLIASDNPSKSRFADQAEKEYIAKSLAGQISTSKRNAKTPWFKILTSPPVLAIVICLGCSGFGGYIVLTELPTYYTEVLNFDAESIGLYSAIPSAGHWVSMLAAVFVADALRRKRILNTTHVRKLMSVSAFGLQGAFLVAAGYSGCGQRFLAVALITAAESASGLQSGGVIVNHVDIAPRFAGTLFGLSDALATFSGIIAPSFVSALTPERTMEEWRVVFWSAAGVLWLGCLVYGLFASGELQSWAVVPTDPSPALAKQRMKRNV